MYAPAPTTSSTGKPARRDRLLQHGPRGRVLLAQVDVGLVGLAEAHRRREPLEQELRAQLHHVAVLDRARLALVGVDDHDARGRLAPDGVPLAPGREAGAAHPRQAGGLEAREHLVLRRARRLADVVGLEQEAVRRVGDAADDVVAVQHDRREVAVAEARHLDRALREQLARARRSRRPARCRRGRRPPAPAGTSRRRRPRARRRGAGSSGRRARPRAPA